MILFKGNVSSPETAVVTSGEVTRLIEEWNRKETFQMTTSGSTGIPKNIDLPKNLIEWSAKQTFRELNLNEKERVLLCIPLDKIGGRMLLYRSLIYDWFLQIQIPKADPLLHLDVSHDFTFVSVVPYQLATILENPTSTKKLKKFKHVLIGGASMSARLEEDLSVFIKTSPVQFYHSYGMTETASHIALRHVNVSPPNYYKLITGVVPSFEMSGALTITIQHLNWTIHTNDIAHLENGYLTFASRNDEVINSGGVKLQLNDIRKKVETALRDQKNLIRFILWKMNDDKLGEKLVFVGLEKDQSPAVKNIVESSLSPYETPKNFYWIDAFERTESGKIDRQKTVDRLIEIGG